MGRFAKIGVGAGKSFDAKSLSTEMQKALTDGMTDALATFQDFPPRQKPGSFSIDRAMDLLMNETSRD